LVKTSGISTPDSGFGRQQAVLSRALCLFQRFDLKDIPVRERPSVAKMRLAKWSPFAETGSWMLWEGGELLTWIWDQRILEEKGLTGNIIPETLLHQVPSGPSVRLVQCLEGFEGQIWTDKGQLVSSHWWSDVPEATIWNRFCRKAEQGSTQLPEPVTVSLRDKPWSANAAHRETQLKRRQVELVWAVLLILGLLLGMGLGDHFRLRQLRSELQANNDHLLTQIEPVFSAREQAIEGLRINRALRKLWPAFRQLELLAATAQQLPEEGLTQMRGWHYTGNELRVKFMTDNPDPGEFVKAFQSMRHFADVSSEPETNKNMMTLHMRIVETVPELAR
jgi:hypothetical protein